MTTPFSVSELNEQIKSSLEMTFSTIYVEGEISNLTYHNSGHIYFSIKDDKSVISCVMFKGNAKYLKFHLKIGQKIIINGSLTVYTPRGNYQLLAQKIQPSGIGSLALAYEQLKAKLQLKGYFDKTIKKELPRYPSCIFVVTSDTGAVIKDMKKILRNRYPLAKMVLLPTLVQGENAKNDIIKNIQLADTLALKIKNSIVIVGRGGGSIEDLWPFNEECVADAIYEATVPIISAVGHESDFVISDFVADKRASTPSNAIEICTPNINDLRQYCDDLQNDFNYQITNILYQKKQLLKHLFDSFAQHSFSKKFEFIQLNINQLKQHFNNTFMQIIKIKQDELTTLKNNFKLNIPTKKDKKGFVQIIKNNKPIDLKLIKINDILTLQNLSFMATCQILSKQKLNKNLQ
jgi:exodeoxyribonuclease VII large subunit